VVTKDGIIDRRHHQNPSTSPDSLVISRLRLERSQCGLAQRYALGCGRIRVVSPKKRLKLGTRIYRISKRS
jgi:hypothetical protein